MISDTTIYSNKLNEIKIGILGLGSAGKTTYHAALAYWLYHHTDTELKHGEPVGVQTREFIDEKVRELISGKFPDSTLTDTQLTYRMKYKTSEYLVNIIDYKGADTPVLHAFDTETPEHLHELESFLAQCHAYFVFIPINDLVKQDADTPIEKFSGVYDIIRYYQDKREKSEKKLQNPMILCVTKSDMVDESDVNSMNKVDSALKRFMPRLKDNVENFDIIFISAVGERFIGDDREKRDDAQLLPKNILQPLKRLFEINEKKKNTKRVIKTLAYICIMMVILFFAGFILKSEAKSRLLMLKESGHSIVSLSDEELEIKRFEVEDLYKNIGFYRAFIFEDVEGIKQDLISKIKIEQDNRKLRDISKDAAENPNKIDDLTKKARKYQSEVSNDNIEKIRETLENAQKKKDENWWTHAKNENTVQAYQNYIAECKDFGTFIEDAQKRILSIKKKSVLNEWNEIIAIIKKKPADFELITEHIRKFAINCPYELRKTIEPAPDKMHDDYIEKWDANEWKKIEGYEKSKVKVINGSFKAIESIIEMYRKYLSKFETPLHEKKAKSSIIFYNKVSKTRTYRVILSDAEYLGGIDDFEKEPDIYVRVYINGILVFDSIDFVLKDAKKPKWNHEFTVDWKAYDVVRIDILDKNIISDDKLTYVQSNTLTSANDVFRNIYYPKLKNWKLRLKFEWLGIKR
ncbi:MAG: hypothetical protein K8S87_10680 [Planctomycetes bacterium]|nr:hypothetical protein [Planctomycetota bacterium]